MKDKAIVMLTGALVVVFGGALYLVTPALESSDRKLEKTVGASAERARRMLDKFNADSDAVEVVLDRAGVTSDLSSDRIDAIVTNDHRDAQANLETEATRINDLRQAATGRHRQLDSEFAELDPGAQLPAARPASLAGSPEQMKSTLAQGAQWRENHQKENRARIRDALSAVDSAMRETEGDASGSNSPSANRLKAIANFQEADTASREAALARADADRALFDMTVAARMLATAENQPNIAKAANVESTIEERRADVAKAEEAHGKAQTAVSELEATIGELNRRIDNQSAIAADARKRMEKLEAEGLDYSLPNAAEQFAASYTAAAREYRTAIRIEHALRHGTLDNARIDATGDYLKGEFVSATPGGEIEYVRGLDDYEADLTAARIELEGRDAELKKARERLDEAQNMRSSIASASERADTRASDLSNRINARFEAYMKAADEARNAEDVAIKKYSEASRAFQRTQQVSMARTTSAPEGMQQDALDRSPYSLMQTDQWVAAEAKCEAADADIWAALVWYERHAQLTRAQAALDEVNKQVNLIGFDAAAMQQAATDAYTEGSNLANGAVKALESASSPLKNHWTVAASVAGANYVLSLFNQPELRGLAIQNYTAVVKDREDDPTVRPFKQRLDQLKNR
ncbi:MAG: hypothetical protein H6817_04475 [Phycisphaerales bacterium]|nr:hypothetical protein [Phycisphaerales bacterium]